MKIYHASDIHLGRRRLEGRLPDKDFSDAFRQIAEAAISGRADVVLITGDLFDRPQVEPTHLRQAQDVLRLLKTAKIPVIAIEGNHDKPFVHDEVPTWCHFLAEDELLFLLRPSFNSQGAVLKPWNKEIRTGSFLDLGGIRFVGAGYLGAATPAKVRQIIAQLTPDTPHVLLLHAGPDYFVGEGGGFSTEDLKDLEKKVCYLALGHIHKPMRHGNWACNPGSPENCELHEESYSRDKQGNPVPRGYAIVEIEPSRPASPLRIDMCSTRRRPCHRVRLDCSPFGTKTKNGAQTFIAAAVKEIASAKPEIDAVIDLALNGDLNLDRITLDQRQAADEIAQQAKVFAVAIDATRLNLDGGFAVHGGVGIAAMPRDELERRSIRDVLKGTNLWGLDESQDRFADLFFELKEAVRLGRSTEEMAEMINSNSILDDICAARSAPPAAPAATPPAAGAEEARP